MSGASGAIGLLKIQFLKAPLPHDLTSPAQALGQVDQIAQRGHYHLGCINYSEPASMRWC